MSWYDPFRLKSRSWSERSPTGKKIYVIYYVIIAVIISVIVWLDEFSDEAKWRKEQERQEWLEFQKQGGE